MAAYGSAAQILEKVLNKKGSVKSLVITSHFPNKKKLYALVCETLKYKVVIEEILEKTQFEKHEKKIKHACALVLVYDFLFGPGLQCGGALKEAVMRNKSCLLSALARLKVKAKVSKNEDLLPKKVTESVSLPRYVRVNTIKTTVADVVQHFVERDFSVAQSDDPRWSKLSGPVPKILKGDEHLPDVLMFPSATDLHDHTLYTDGHILLQDKASCFPARVLNPPVGSHVIDACAAPGNKTSHVASLMNNKGRIFAFDIDSRRLKIMQKMMVTAGVKCVTTKNCSFLDVDPSDSQYAEVQYILVDPSCSGSGIVSRMDCLVDSGTELVKQEKRLASLAKFQLSVLHHALSFPAVKRVVYSTCSIHQEENEGVVQKALEANGDRFELGHALPSWSHRGNALFPEAVKCVRTSPDQDSTNGFFVALFVRRNTTDSTREQKLPEIRHTSANPTSGISVVTSSVNTTSTKKRKRKRRKDSEHVTSSGDLSSSSLTVVPPFVNLSKKSKKKKRRKH